MRRFDKKQNIQKANLIAEQRYLESKGLIKEGIQMGLPIQKEEELDEIGPETAAKAMTGKYSSEEDSREKRVLQDAVKSMFKKYYQNPEANFIIKIGNGEPTKFTMTDLGYFVDHHDVGFTFTSDNEDEDSGKTTWGITYEVQTDSYVGGGDFMVNPFTANFLVAAANAIRKMYYTRFPKKNPTEGWVINSKVKKQDFMFF